MGAIRRFFGDLFHAYRNGVRSVIALWPLFALFVGSEFLQHAAEVHVGFFVSKEAARALSNDGSRMALGWIKMLSVYIGGFFVIRYLAQRNGRPVLDPLGAAAKRYTPYIAYSLGLFALLFYGPQVFTPSAASGFRAAIGLLQIAAEPLLILWIVSAATNGDVTGPIQSARLTGSSYLRALALFFIGRIPINAAHALLNVYAIGKSPTVLWTMLAFDAGCVGLIIAIIPALYVRIACSIGEHRSLDVRDGRLPQAT